jgi:hypothetical protein
MIIIEDLSDYKYQVIMEWDTLKTNWVKRYSPSLSHPGYVQVWEKRASPWQPNKEPVTRRKSIDRLATNETPFHSHNFLLHGDAGE